MHRTYAKNVRRTISETRGRFLAIFAIVLLGVGFLAGLLSATPDMRASFDDFFDASDMRTTRGISKDEYFAIYRSGFDKIEYLLSEYENKGWVRQAGDRWRFTSSGFLLSNILIGTLLEAQSQAKMNANPWITERLDEPEPRLSMPDNDVLNRG